MANPQITDGYLMIVTEIYDALCKIRVSGEARQVLDTIIRKTYGWNKKFDTISLSQFSLSTGLKRPTVVRAINKLLSMNLIIKKDNSLYGFQKDFEVWKPLSKKITLSKKIIPVIKKDNLLLSKKIHTIDTITTDTITKDIYTPIFDLWNSKNIITHKTLTDKMKSVINSLLKQKYTEQDIKTAIDNYAYILQNDIYYFNYKWTLVDFLHRGFEKFKNLEIAKRNYIDSKKQESKQEDQENKDKAEQVKEFKQLIQEKIINIGGKKNGRDEGR